MKFRIADINIEFFPRYPSVERFCEKYAADFEAPDIKVTVSEADIAAEQAAGPVPRPAGYAESICLYREVSKQLGRFDAFILHASVVEYDGKAYAFSAPSGTGKSTHTALWLKVFGDRARIINGDKPIIRRDHAGIWRAYGTPWCGKERLGCNASAPLAGLCFIRRAEKNSIEKIDGQALLSRLFSQVIVPIEKEDAAHFLDLLSSVVQETPCYLLSCNMEDEAAIVAKNGMTAEKK